MAVIDDAGHASDSRASAPAHRRDDRWSTLGRELIPMLFGDEHVRRYEETDGEEGHDWERDAPVLVLTTTGRKTGKEHKFALIYQEVDGDYVVVASKGGADKHPGWYLNLVHNPEVKVQVKADKFAARARTTEGDERVALWSRMAEVWPKYDDYQRKTAREIPVVLLERV
jgi:deazaflavin-dependent oxidoreductase (nitroreductase family)